MKEGAWFLFVIGVVVGSLILILIMSIIPESTDIDTTNPITEREANQWSADPFLLMNDFADAHEYNEENYNCVNYTNDGITMLEEHGYKGYKRCGCKKDEFEDTGDSIILSCHDWIYMCFTQSSGDEFCVDIDPQTARVVDYSAEYPRKC